MQMEFTATTLDLQDALATKRVFDELLAEARLNLSIAQSRFAAAIAAHNQLYRDRVEALADARAERCGVAKDADWQESESRLLSFADWAEDELYNDRCYYSALFALDRAEDEVEWLRAKARLAGKEHYQLLVAFRAGLVVDDAYDNYDEREYQCDCPLCRGYGYYWDDEDYYFADEGEDDDLEEESLALEALRVKRRTQKAKSYKLQRRQQKNRH